MITPEEMSFLVRERWEKRWTEIRQELLADIKKVVEIPGLDANIRTALGLQSQLLVTAMLNIATTLAFITTDVVAEVIGVDDLPEVD